MPQHILFFADRLPPLPGGMEVHAGYFIEHFTNHQRFPLAGLITKDDEGEDCLVKGTDKLPIRLKELPKLFAPRFVFFNSGRWIEELPQIRNLFSNAMFLYRTGGNEIIKAPLTRNQIPDHSLRQTYWASTLNEAIDLMITNSAYTEARLRTLNLTCPFARVVGGVNTAMLKRTDTLSNSQPIRIFCAARFVPYKNHALLISLIHKLIFRGYNISLRLAGDGPLFTQIQQQVQQLELGPFVEFLGVLDNKATCQEITHADFYMQLSGDYTTEVEGGSYIHSECMGRSLLEALTAGTFVIAGNSGACSEIVTKERGLLVDLDNINQITDKIEDLIKDPPLRQPFMNDYCWENIFKSYERILEDFNENIVSH
jgi:glycosyltransferase involved in cell wall biosynthesis